jgi:ketosteroid isomerase-like protein
MGLVTDHTTVKRWVAGYELAWRTTRTDGLAALFTADATYLHSPYEQPVVGLHAIRQMWDKDRDGADEIFALATDVLAVEGDTAVVRAEVRYGDPIRQEYRDLWILRLTDDGRCAWFEEWPYCPGVPTLPAMTPPWGNSGVSRCRRFRSVLTAAGSSTDWRERSRSPERAINTGNDPGCVDK